MHSVKKLSKVWYLELLKADVTDAAYNLARGWTIINGTKYYFNEDGTKLTGTQQIDSETYYFNDDGALITGWVNENGKKYYKDSHGKNLIGTHKIGQKTYHFDNSGALIQNKNAKKEHSSFTQSSNTAQSECQVNSYPNKNYHNIDDEDDGGSDVMDIEEIEELLGNKKEAIVTLDFISDNLGKSIIEIYNYVRNNLHCINASGGSVDELVNFALENCGGTSQHYAALTYKLLKKSGYNTKIVQGTLHGNTHFWNQVEYDSTWYHIDTFSGKYMIPEGQLDSDYCY